MVLSKKFFAHMDDYFEYRKDIYQVSAQTIKSNRVDINLFRSFIENNEHRKISGPVAIQFQYHLKKERNNSGGSINRKLFTLRSYSQYLALLQLPGADKLPFYDVLKVRQGYRNRPNSLTIDQVRQLFATIDRDTIKGVRDYAVYALMYQAGLRVGEVHQLDIEHIDFKQNRLAVTGKGKKRRTLHLTKELSQVLAEYIAVRCFTHKSDQQDALFVSKKGNRLAIRTMEDNFKKYYIASNLDMPFNVTCHTLRHSFASHLNDKKVDILIIQNLMGHASTRSTEPYIHPSLESVRVAIEKLPAVMLVNKLVETGKIKLRFG